MDEWLASGETGVAFTHCVCCKVPLLEIDAAWLVNKEYLRDECVLEYAICQPCRDDVADRFSEESKASVRNFLEREIDWEARTREFMLAHELTERFDACIACCTPRERLDGFGVSALFDSGGALVAGPLPLLLCKSCVTRVLEKFSEDSRAVWREFLELNFAGPPSDGGITGLM